MTIPAWHNDPAALAAAHEQAPRGVWLAGLPMPAINFWPTPQPTTGTPVSTPYACRCAPGDSWACKNFRCPCSGREKSLGASERVVGFGELVPLPMVGLPASCCAIQAWLRG